MRALLRPAGVLAAVAAAYLLVLALGGVVAEGCVVERVRARMARSLEAEVTIGGADVSLLSGRIELRDVRVERTVGPHVLLTAARVDADVASMGWLLVDRDIHDLAVSGVSLSISAAGAATLPRAHARPPIPVHHMTLRDAHVEAMLTAYLPALGRVALDIDRAETARIDLRDLVSWLYHLRALDGRVELPGGTTGTARYADGKLHLGGGLLGAEPADIPFALPVPPPDQLEVARLGHLAAELAVEIGKVALERRAKGAAREWLEDRLEGGVKRLLDR